MFIRLDIYFLSWADDGLLEPRRKGRTTDRNRERKEKEKERRESQYSDSHARRKK